MSYARRTIGAPITLKGVGLFTGKASTIELLPSDEPLGLRFALKKKQLPVHINTLSTRPVHPAFERMPARCTSITDGTTHIATIEHVLSALVGLGITDAVVRVSGPEVPILDGSARPFVDAILDAGTPTFDQSVELITIRETIRVEDSHASITIDPADAPSYQYTLDYGEDTPIASATVQWSGSQENYINHIAPARTFCLESEADAMHNAGLFTHLTPRDMLVISDNGPIDNEYRFEDECAAHKLLDLIGDLALVGAPLCAKVTAVRSGHALAHQAARAIVDQISGQ